MGRTLKDCIPVISFLSVFIYSLALYPFAFNFEENERGNYTIAFLTIFSATTYSLLSVFDKEDKLGYSNFIFFILLGFEVYWISTGNEYASVVGAFCIQSCLLNFLSIERLKIIMYAIVALYIAQIIFGGYSLIDDDKHSLEGSLHNSGVFSMFSIIFIPLFSYLMQKHFEGKLFKILYSVYILVIILIILLTKSRTSLIAVIIVFVLPLCISWIKTQTTALKAILSFLTIFFGILIFNYLYFLKSGSSSGRLLMLEVAFSHVKDNFWFGLGLGKFTWYYPQWQADYFKSFFNPSPSYFLSAGETYVVFNEFLQLFITIGAVGFIPISILLIRLFRIKPRIEEKLFKMIKTTFLLILCCSLTYYAIHVNTILLLISLFVVVSAKVYQVAPLFPVRGFNIYGKILVFSAAFLSLIFSFQKYYATLKWSETKSGISNFVDIHKPESNFIFSALQNDGKFLAEYGNYIFEHGGDLKTPTDYLERSKHTFISRKSVENLAYLYLQQKQYENAAENFEWLVNYMPNIYSYRLELLRIYQKTTLNSKAKKMALEILKMPVKIPSKEVDLIKLETISIYKQL